jgi:hypothetical protein
MQAEIELRQEPQLSADRRRSTRYRFSVPITVWRADCSGTPAMVIEISETGLSACFNVAVPVGETVELEPVGGGRIPAIVRRVTGKVHGFEFLHLSAELLSNVRSDCRFLPVFNGGATGI